MLTISIPVLFSIVSARDAMDPKMNIATRNSFMYQKYSTITESFTPVSQNDSRPSKGLLLGTILSNLLV